MQEARFQIVTLNHISLYIQDYRAAVEFYTRVFGEPDSVAEGRITGWHLGDTWLTLFPGRDGTQPDSNPHNVEFAIQVATRDEVDRLHEAFLAAGAKNCWTPEDTEMYEPMRFACAEDPFGMRIDIIYPTG